MRVTRKGNTIKRTFEAAWEGLATIAGMNERHFRFKAAADLYRQAQECAPDDQREWLRESAERCDRASA